MKLVQGLVTKFELLSAVLLSLLHVNFGSYQLIMIKARLKKVKCIWRSSVMCLCWGTCFSIDSLKSGVKKKCIYFFYPITTLLHSVPSWWGSVLLKVQYSIPAVLLKTISPPIFHNEHILLLRYCSSVAMAASSSIKCSLQKQMTIMEWKGEKDRLYAEIEDENCPPKTSWVHVKLLHHAFWLLPVMFPMNNWYSIYFDLNDSVILYL